MEKSTPDISNWPTAVVSGEPNVSRYNEYLHQLLDSVSVHTNSCNNNSSPLSDILYDYPQLRNLVSSIEENEWRQGGGSFGTIHKMDKYIIKRIDIVNTPDLQKLPDYNILTRSILKNASIKKITDMMFIYSEGTDNRRIRISAPETIIEAIVGFKSTTWSGLSAFPKTHLTDINPNNNFVTSILIEKLDELSVVPKSIVPKLHNKLQERVPGKVNTNQLCRIMIIYMIFDLCYNLYAAHQKFGFRHNDLHYGNIMIRQPSDNTHTNRVYIIDDKPLVLDTRIFGHEYVMIDFGKSSISTDLMEVTSYPHFEPVTHFQRVDTDIVRFLYSLYKELDSVFDYKCEDLFGVPNDTLEKMIEDIYIKAGSFRTNNESILQSKSDIPLTIINTLAPILRDKNDILVNMLGKVDTVSKFVLSPITISTPMHLWQVYGESISRLNRYFNGIIKVDKIVGEYSRAHYHLASNHMITDYIYYYNSDMYKNHTYLIKIEKNKEYSFKVDCCGLSVPEYMRRYTGVAMNGSFFLIQNNKRLNHFLPIGRYKGNRIFIGGLNRAHEYEFDKQDYPEIQFGYVVISDKGTKLSILNADDIKKVNTNDADIIIMESGPLLIYDRKILINSQLFAAVDANTEKMKYVCTNEPLKLDDPLPKPPLFERPFNPEITLSGFIGQCQQDKTLMNHIGNPNPRSAIAIDSEGVVYFVVVPGRKYDSDYGMDLAQLSTTINRCLNGKAVAAINMDGGGSSMFAIRAPDVKKQAVFVPWVLDYKVGSVISYTKNKA